MSARRRLAGPIVLLSQLSAPGRDPDDDRPMRAGLGNHPPEVTAYADLVLTLVARNGVAGLHPLGSILITYLIGQTRCAVPRQIVRVTLMVSCSPVQRKER